MDTVIYIQCDTRYNSYLLNKIQGKTVLEYAISNAKMTGEYKVIACIYDCMENREAGEVLHGAGVEVTYSDEEHVNKRFIQSVINREEKYVIRVAGDQLLLNSKLMKSILGEMKKENYEFFYPQTSGSAIVADVVQTDTLRKYYDDVVQAGRYFHPLLSKPEIRRYMPGLPGLFYSCRANSDEGYFFSKKVVEEKLDLLELQNNLIARLCSEESELRKSGMWRSWLLGNLGDFFYDEDGCVNPWWCESAVNLTKSKVMHTPEIRVFEWGAGNSTLFWAHYVREVVSVESDREWYQKMKKLVPDHVRMSYRELIYGGGTPKPFCMKKESSISLSLMAGTGCGVPETVWKS